MNAYLNAGEIDPSAVTRNEDAVDAVSMDGASFAWDRNDSSSAGGRDNWFDGGDDTSSSVAVRDYDVNVSKGSLVAVVGQVGAGKSSFLSALTADMEKVSCKSKDAR